MRCVHKCQQHSFSLYILPQERDEWVSAIEQQILSSLQLNLSDKSKVSPSAWLFLTNFVLCSYSSCEVNIKWLIF